MRPFYFVILIVLFPAFNIAQAAEMHHHKPSHIYVHLTGGYNFGFAGQTTFDQRFFNGSASVYNNSYSFTTKFNSSSFGQGGMLGLSAGYQVNQFLGTELGAMSMFAPTSAKFVQNYIGGIPESNTYTTVAHPIYITASATGKTNYATLNAYGRLGIALPIKDNITQQYKGQSNGNSGALEYSSTNYTCSFSPGFTGAAGVSYLLSRMLTVTLEVSGIMRNAYAKKSTITVYTENGVDKLSTFTTSDKESVYGYSLSSGGLITSSLPTDRETFAIPFSMLGINIGVKYFF